MSHAYIIAKLNSFPLLISNQSAPSKVYNFILVIGFIKIWLVLLYLILSQHKSTVPKHNLLQEYEEINKSRYFSVQLETLMLKSPLENRFYPKTLYLDSPKTPSPGRGGVLKLFTIFNLLGLN